MGGLGGVRCVYHLPRGEMHLERRGAKQTEHFGPRFRHASVWRRRFPVPRVLVKDEGTLLSLAQDDLPLSLGCRFLPNSSPMVAHGAAVHFTGVDR